MKPIDLNRLQDFSDGTEAGLRDLAAMLVGHMEECLAAIRRGVTGQDSEVVRSESHRGAGTFGACGAGPLSALLARIETLAGVQNLDEASALVPEAEREVAKVREVLAARFDSLGIDSAKADQ
jgi:HPt (histidine-containing phosphotransfer) domain-containing protein